MSFDYDTIRARKHESGTQWAAYSDLFMVLAFVFLLMYMVSSLRTGMISVASHVEIEEIKQELQFYESVKNQYLEQESGEREKKIYNEILNQITLLETEANQNKQRLAQESEQQRMRETSLNQYQQLIVEMINANTIARAEASKKFVSEKQQKELLEKDIDQQSTELATLVDQLNMEVAEKAETVGVAKAAIPAVQMLVLAVMAGAFIALGAVFATTAVTPGDVALPYGVGRVLAGLAFCLGLILVVIGSFITGLMVNGVGATRPTTLLHNALRVGRA